MAVTIHVAARRMSQMSCLTLPSSKSKQRHESLDVSGIYISCLSFQTLYQKSVVPCHQEVVFNFSKFSLWGDGCMRAEQPWQSTRAELLYNSERLIFGRLRREMRHQCRYVDE